MNPVDELTNSLINHNLFFFAGSGISIQAGLPSVSDVLSGTYKKYLPDIIKGDYTHGNKRKKDTGTDNAVNALKNGQSKGYLAIASKKPNKPRLNEKEMKAYWKYVERMESKHLGKVVSYITKIYLEHFNFAVLSLPVYLAQTEHILRLSDIFPKHHIYHLNYQHIQCFYWLNNG